MNLFCEIKDSTLWIKIQDPKNGNAFSPSMAKELSRWLSKKKLFSGVIWTTHHEGPFCGGGNLKHYAKAKNKKTGVQDNRTIRKALDQLYTLDCPTVAVVEADVFGGGIELLSCFDYVVSAPHVFFGFWQRKIALTYGWGGGARLSKKISPHKLLSLTLVADFVSVHQVVDLGLVEALSNEPLTLATRWLSKTKALPLTPVKSLKQLRGIDKKEEVKAFEQVWYSKEHQSILKKQK